MALDLAQKTYIEARLANDGPSITLAYFFWLLLGIFSAHRFYLGRTGTAVLQIISYFFVVGLIWFIIDAFLIPGLVREKQNEMRRRIALEALGQGALGQGALGQTGSGQDGTTSVPVTGRP